MQRIQGLTASAVDLQLPANFTTRTEEWRIEPRKDEVAAEAVSPPWTRFNNCAPDDFIEFFQGTMKTKGQGSSGNPRGAEPNGHRDKKPGIPVADRTIQTIKNAQIHASIIAARTSHCSGQNQGSLQ